MVVDGVNLKTAAPVPKIRAHTGAVYAARAEIRHYAKLGIVPSAKYIGNKASVIEGVKIGIIGVESG